MQSFGWPSANREGKMAVTSKDTIRAKLIKCGASSVPDAAIEAFQRGQRIMASRRAMESGTNSEAFKEMEVKAVAAGKRAEEYEMGKTESSIEERVRKIEDNLSTISSGRKIAPKDPKSYEAPTVFAKGMRKDTDPLNWAAYIRGSLTNNWKHADREREIYDTLTTGSGSGDGLVPSIVGSEVILDLLGVSALGDSLTQMVYLESGAIQVPQETTAASAEWADEGDSLSDATEVIGSASISPHKLAVYLTVSNELVEDAPQVADRHIRQALLNSMARGLDSGFLNGTGSDNQPTGLFAGSPTYAVDKANTTLSFDMITEAVNDILGEGGVRENIRIIGHPDAFTYLDGLREDTSSGGYLQASAPVEPGRVITNKVAVSTGTPDSTDLLIGDFRQGVTCYNFGNFRLAVDPSAAFQSDSIAFRLTQRVDFLVQYPELLVRLDSVDLG